MQEVNVIDSVVKLFAINTITASRYFFTA